MVKKKSFSDLYYFCSTSDFECNVCFTSFSFQDKVLKFANYFLSRKHVHQLKSAYHMLAAVNTLTDNKVSILSVSLATS